MNRTLILLVAAAGTAVALAGCGAAAPTAARQPAAAPPAAPLADVPDPTPAVVGDARAGKGTPGEDGFVCGAQSGGTGGPVPPLARVRDVRAARHDGFDRFVIEFEGAGPVPPFEVRPQPTARFTQDASGRELTLLGAAGVAVMLREAEASGGFAGPTDLRPGLPLLRQARQTGGFEGVASWGLGVAAPVCVRVATLERPTRLVLDLRG